MPSHVPSRRDVRTSSWTGRSSTPTGSVHDLTCAQDHALGALYAAGSHGLPTLADPGYNGAGIGIHVPFKQPTDGRRLGLDNRTYNKLLRAMRALGERGFALLVGRWRVLRHITASPSLIGDIAKAALVLTQFEHGYLPGKIIPLWQRPRPRQVGPCSRAR